MIKEFILRTNFAESAKFLMNLCLLLFTCKCSNIGLSEFDVETPNNMFDEVHEVIVDHMPISIESLRNCIKFHEELSRERFKNEKEFYHLNVLKFKIILEKQKEYVSYAQCLCNSIVSTIELSLKSQFLLNFPLLLKSQIQELENHLLLLYLQNNPLTYTEICSQLSNNLEIIIGRFILEPFSYEIYIKSMHEKLLEIFEFTSEMAFYDDSHIDNIKKSRNCATNISECLRTIIIHENLVFVIKLYNFHENYLLNSINYMNYTYSYFLEQFNTKKQLIDWLTSNFTKIFMSLKNIRDRMIQLKNENEKKICLKTNDLNEKIIRCLQKCKENVKNSEYTPSPAENVTLDNKKVNINEISEIGKIFLDIYFYFCYLSDYLFELSNKLVIFKQEPIRFANEYSDDFMVSYENRLGHINNMNVIYFDFLEFLIRTFCKND